MKPTKHKSKNDLNFSASLWIDVVWSKSILTKYEAKKLPWIWCVYFTGVVEQEIMDYVERGEFNQDPLFLSGLSEIKESPEEEESWDWKIIDIFWNRLPKTSKRNLAFIIRTKVSSNLEKIAKILPDSIRNLNRYKILIETDLGKKEYDRHGVVSSTKFQASTGLKNGLK